ncbi:hypothetical protein JW887_00535 [Candidatus Dojkabacteria bacterium]|nr:hypothetical protein [Candidatus Dojkabacteria bacterium]
MVKNQDVVEILRLSAKNSTISNQFRKKLRSNLLSRKSPSLAIYFIGFLSFLNHKKLLLISLVVIVACLIFSRTSGEPDAPSLKPEGIFAKMQQNDINNLPKPNISDIFSGKNSNFIKIEQRMFTGVAKDRCPLLEEVMYPPIAYSEKTMFYSFSENIVAVREISYDKDNQVISASVDIRDSGDYQSLFYQYQSDHIDKQDDDKLGDFLEYKVNDYNNRTIDSYFGYNQQFLGEREIDGKNYYIVSWESKSFCLSNLDEVKKQIVSEQGGLNFNNYGQIEENSQKEKLVVVALVDSDTFNIVQENYYVGDAKKENLVQTYKYSITRSFEKYEDVKDLFNLDFLGLEVVDNTLEGRINSEISKLISLPIVAIASDDDGWVNYSIMAGRPEKGIIQLASQGINKGDLYNPEENIGVSLFSADTDNSTIIYSNNNFQYGYKVDPPSTYSIIFDGVELSALVYRFDPFEKYGYWLTSSEQKIASAKAEYLVIFNYEGYKYVIYAKGPVDSFELPEIPEFTVARGKNKYKFIVRLVNEFY